MINGALHCTVSGRVQGVFFRAKTCQQAIGLNLTGWVRNLSDGRVEVFACGPQIALTKFLDWLHRGPTLASVTEVNSYPAQWGAYDNFTIYPTA